MKKAASRAWLWFHAWRGGEVGSATNGFKKKSELNGRKHIPNINNKNESLF
jgi:hypothetical protein